MAACVGILAAVTSAPAAGKPSNAHHPCDAHRRGAALVTKQVVVFGKLNRSTVTTTYFACLRPNGTRVRLGDDVPGDGEYGSDATTGGFRAAGTYVAAQSTSGFASAEMCSKYQQSPCPQGRSSIRTIDARTRRFVDFPTSRDASAVTVSHLCAIAWLQNDATNGGSALFATALRPEGPTALLGSPQQLDTGAIDRRSLLFTGLTLHWNKAGQPYAQALP